MSAYKKIKTEYRNVQSLFKALRDLKFLPEFAANLKDNCLPLIGYRGDERPERAAVRIPREQVGECSNDIGFAWNGSEYEAIISDWDGAGSGLQTRFSVERQNLLKQRYAVHEARYLATLQGYSVDEITLADGTVQLVCNGGY